MQAPVALSILTHGTTVSWPVPGPIARLSNFTIGSVTFVIQNKCSLQVLLQGAVSATQVTAELGSSRWTCALTAKSAMTWRRPLLSSLPAAAWTYSSRRTSSSRHVAGRSHAVQRAAPVLSSAGQQSQRKRQRAIPQLPWHAEPESGAEVSMRERQCRLDQLRRACSQAAQRQPCGLQWKGKNIC